MKIKVNNIFKKIYIKKQNISKRRNQNLQYNKEESKPSYVSEEAISDGIKVRRRGAINSKSKFNVLNIFKGKFAINKNYYVLFVFMSILAVISIYTNFQTNRNLNEESFEVFGNNNIDNTEEIESSISESLQDSTSNNSDTRKTQEVQTVTTSPSTAKITTKPKVIPLSFSIPLNGEIIKGYSSDKLIYSSTLEAWKTHDGIDIKADIGTSVKSIEKGIVERIYEDSFFGVTVIIDHGQGYKSIYSNLDAVVSVKEKENITKSKIIGKVGKTSIGEIKDESHIHFMLMLNNKVIDPTSKIKF